MFEINNNQSYESMMTAFKNNGAQVVDKIKGQVRGLPSDNGFDVGDIIEWPSELKFLQIPMGGTDRQGNPIYAYGLICNIKNGDSNRLQVFYPSSLGKSIRYIELDSEGKVVKDNYEYVRPKGEAATDYQSKTNLEIDTVIRDMIKNHPNGLKVTAKEPVDTYKFRSTETTKASRYTFDYA